MAQNRNQLKEASGGSRLKTDLGILSKWRVSDAKTYGQTLLHFTEDLTEMTDTQEDFKQAIRVVTHSSLKGDLRLCRLRYRLRLSPSHDMARRDHSYRQSDER